MPTYKITYNMTANVQGQYVAPGISVQVTTLMPIHLMKQRKLDRLLYVFTV